MGDLSVKSVSNNKKLTQQYMLSLLADLSTLEDMLSQNIFTAEEPRIGVEQELCIVDNNCKAAPKALELLESLNKPDIFVSEIAKFNIEINLPALDFKGDCLSKMEQLIIQRIDLAKQHAKKLNCNIAMAGILPTIRHADVSMKNITPFDRYKLLCESITRFRGEKFELHIEGLDELHMYPESPLIEGCNTGFQVHIQINPDEYVSSYNTAQAIAAPVMAISANSPILFYNRLWHETRIALFQQSIDTRKFSEHARQSYPRVTFGSQWVKKNIAEIFREDITRYRAMIVPLKYTDSRQELNEGKLPTLSTLKTHNGTIYRWNRLCYGVTDGKVHMRIENRILPSGPTVTDEIANASFWLGLMNQFHIEYPNFTEELSFESVRKNFFDASQEGLNSVLTWFDGKHRRASDIILKDLLPIAEKGLKNRGINEQDISYYLGVIEQRCKKQVTGSSWILNSFDILSKNPYTSKENVLHTITNKMVEMQNKNKPIHQWSIPQKMIKSLIDINNIIVEELMTRDLWSVHPYDVIELPMKLMEWHYIRYIAVEDNQHKLIGLITMRGLMKYISTYKVTREILGKKIVKDVMIKDIITISPNESIRHVINLMGKNTIGCLPVVSNNKLVGMVTEHEFVRISMDILQQSSNNRYKQL